MKYRATEVRIVSTSLCPAFRLATSIPKYLSPPPNSSQLQPTRRLGRAGHWIHRPCLFRRRSLEAAWREASPKPAGWPRRTVRVGAGTGAGRTKRSPAGAAPSEAGMAASRARQATKVTVLRPYGFGGATSASASSESDGGLKGAYATWSAVDM